MDKPNGRTLPHRSARSPSFTGYYVGFDEKLLIGSRVVELPDHGGTDAAKVAYAEADGLFGAVANIHEKKRFAKS